MAAGGGFLENQIITLRLAVRTGTAFQVAAVLQREV